MNVTSITNRKGRLTYSGIGRVANQLYRVLGKSRFRAMLELLPSGFSISDVRLRASKPYCGNHPNACELGGNERSPRALYLEGADWVEFDDLLNNFFDRRRLSARISSANCIVRKHELRRTYYGSYSLGFGNRIWNRDECDAHYIDNRGGKHMISGFPDGTPGIYGKIRYKQVG